MSDLKIADMKVDEMLERDFKGYSISLKEDGTLMYWVDGNLISPRGINRNDRFSHIVKLLKEHNFPNCMGGMFIENGKVFDITSSENWKNALYMPFDLLDKSKGYFERLKILKNKVSEVCNDSIRQMITFSSAIEGWNYVLENDSEGLVIRNEREWIKVKKLIEKKIKIKSHEAGSEKGCFILEDGNRVSGTSKDFVETFYDISARGNEAEAEVEFCFYTEDKKMFQPRLRQIVEVKI